uniref:Uncharacterized protein n=1 Tax=Timema genevievae TaxID=629358 RepID=A0A7R9JRZ9_TIMGE|nr:unnamed protein product [Timema genevievae]
MNERVRSGFASKTRTRATWDKDGNLSYLSTGHIPSVSLGCRAKLITRSTRSDHVYEPISPPPEPRKEPAMEAAEKREEKEGSEDEGSSISSRERRFLRIPLDDDLAVVPGDGEDEDEAMAGKELGGNGDEPEISPQELQTRIEERFFNDTPTTTGSRTDGEFNTSQIDSSGLEDLPLKKEARKKKQQEMSEEEKQSQARSFQQRIRSQAGRLRTKLRNIKKPSFNMPERPKFHLPERPKFNLPERPKFTMPERPKFNFPERPKFNMPQRPKISMPTLSSLSSRTKGRSVFSSTRRPLRERSANVSTVSTTSSKKKMFDFDFKTYPRIFDRKLRAKGEFVTASPKTKRGQTPPPTTPFRKKGPVGQRWLHRFTDIKFADDDNPPSGSDEARKAIERQSSDQTEEDEFAKEDRYRDERDEEEDTREELDEEEDTREERPGSGHTVSTSAFHDKDYAYALTMAPERKETEPLASSGSIQESDREQISSGSSSDRHRQGVLEEIDSDEFFLRQKGISQEDVDVGRMLTSEIREAFRQPANTLSQIDKYEYYDDEEEDDVEQLGQQYRATPEREPMKPARTRSLRPGKRSSKSKESSPTEEPTPEFYNTFPPTRPKRSRRTRQQDDDTIEPEDFTREEAQSQEEMDTSKQAGSEEREQDLREERVEQPSFVITDTEEQTNQQSFDEPSEEVPEDFENQWQMEENVVEDTGTPPMVIALRMEGDYIIPDAPHDGDFDMPPVPPKRVRRKSSRGTSIADEDRTSRGASSLPSERDLVNEDEDLQGDIELEFGGYASVTKVVPAKPERPRRPKPPRPPAPGRRKRSRFSQFFSLPRKSPPKRPLRNYSTLGPSRPPRRGRVAEPRYIEQDNKSESYIEIGDNLEQMNQEESHGSSRDLQSGDVIERMKGRPLPAPPRPPRKGRDGRDAIWRADEEEMEIEDEQLDSQEAFDNLKEEEALAALSDKLFYSQQETDITEPQDEDYRQDYEQEETKEVITTSEQTSFEPEEVSVSTQTDPLPDDYCMDGGYDAEDLQSNKVNVETETKTKRTVPESTKKMSMDKTCIPEVSTQTPMETLPTPGVCEPAVIGRLVCGTRASPESTVVEEPESKKAEVEHREPESKRKAPTPPPTVTQTIIERHIPVYMAPDQNTEVEVLRTQRLQVGELDVERLNVGELQAQKIKVSDIDGMSMSVTELTSKSGNLVVGGLELPSAFLQELYDSRPTPLKVCVESSHTQTPSAPDLELSPTSVQRDQQTPPTSTQQTFEVRRSTSPNISSQLSTSQVSASIFSTPPVSSPLTSQINTSSPHSPIHYPLPTNVQSQNITSSVPHQQLPTYMPITEPIHSFLPEYIPPSIPVSARVPSRSHIAPVQRDLESEEEMISLVPSTSSRRRRHHVSKPASRYSSDEEEEEYTSFHPPPRRHLSSRGESSVSELSQQLVQACHGAAIRTLRQMWQYVMPHAREGEERKRDLQIALCILLVLVAALVLMGFGSGKTFHHHHWDYYFPPTP